MSGNYRGPGSSVAAETVNLEGDKGDITVSNAGETWTIDPNAVTFSKIQNVATDTLLGRSTSGTGNVETITCTAAGRALLDDADATAQRATLNLGDMAVQNSNDVDITGGAIAGLDVPLAVGDGGTGASTQANARSNLGLVIGTDVLAYDANLQSFVNTFTLPTTDSTAGFYLKTDGAGNLGFQAPGGIADGDYGDITVSGGGASWNIDAGVVTTTELGGDITVAGKALLDDADAAAQRTTLGLGTIATQNSNNVTITGGSITGITDLAIADGGTGASTAGAAFDNLKQAASDTATGVVELATSAEYLTGTDTDRVLTVAVARQGNVYQAVAQAAGGTAIDFTGLPSWLNHLVITLDGFSTNGTNIPQVVLGDSGGFEVTGYSGSVVEPGVATSNLSSGFSISNNTAAASIWNGSVHLTRQGGTNTWVAVSNMGKSDIATFRGMGGAKTLSATLTQARVTAGGNTLDAGTIGLTGW